MRRLFAAALCVALLVSAAAAFAGAKDKYGGKISTRNIQLQNQAVWANKETDEISAGEDMKKYKSAETGHIPQSATYAVYSTKYNASLEEDIADVKGEINFEVFGKGMVKIPIVRKDGVGLIEVSVNRGASYVMAEGNKYMLIVDKPGKYRLELEYLIKVNREREGGPGQFNVEMMPAPVSEFEFTIAETRTDVFIEPSIKTETKEEKDKTVAWAIMPMTNNILVRWTKALPKETIARVKLEPKVYSTVNNFFSVGEGVLRCNTVIGYSILQAEISAMRVEIPEDVTVLEVRAGDLRDWKVVKEAGRQLLDVYLKYGVKGNFNMEFISEKPIGDGSIVAQLPVIRPLGVERNNGFIGIASMSNVELKVNKLQKASAIDVKELPPSIWDRSSNPILLAFKYLNDDYDIQVEVTKHEEIPVLVAAIDQANYVTLITDEGKSLTKAVFQLRNNVKQFLKLTLPADATLWSASVSGVPVKPAKDKEGHVLIPLEKSKLRGEGLSQIPVEIVYLEKGAKLGFIGKLSLDLPKADIPTNVAYWSVFLPKDLNYFGFGGDIKKAEEDIELFSLSSTVGEGRGARNIKVSGSVEEKAEYMNSFDRAQQQVRVEREVLDKASQRGVFPIKIDVPQVGKAFRFSKLLLAEDEGAHLSVGYNAIFKGRLGSVVTVIIIAIAVISAVVLLKKRK
ncbi:MAG: hypothetical protein PHX64_02575 [Candidatus Omnitrophica bacterium]|nr:hypothetical protein [Candidatus Omnitrophota bacterium]MDD5310617.1 hypothetical protein [Candidatus Omnitrophota bacterium]MDD5545621.1 hypothetical protein [Candidatus Omnitrophota bacterium]